MGKINKGILGGFSGKVGNVIGASWKGIDYMRVKAAKVNNPRTEGQLDQRSKFSKVLHFLIPMKDFLKTGFKQYAIKMTEFNSALSYNIKNAVTGTYPNQTVDYANALVSRGDLTGVLNGSASSTALGTVTFSWDDNSGTGSAKATDNAMLLVFNPDKEEALYITDGPSRDSTTADLTIPDDYAGDTVHAYLAFISDEDKDVSDSKYMGSIAVSS